MPDRDTLIELARYCAFRAQHFRCDVSSNLELERMASINLDRALGLSSPLTLPIERPVIADARMMRQEWIRTRAGSLLKLDASSHGDDHFYPGPTDIAWDLAGAIVEWRLYREASDLLISEYQRSSGDAVQERLPAYLIAYCAFGLGFTLSAAQSGCDASERGRFHRDAAAYEARLTSLLKRSTAA